MINEFKKPEFQCCRYKNGKLYMFTEEKITVVKMTPNGPVAWCKSSERPFFAPCRLPEIYPEAMREAIKKPEEPAVEENVASVDPFIEYPSSMKYHEYVKYPVRPKYSLDDMPDREDVRYAEPKPLPKKSEKMNKFYQYHINPQVDFFRDNFDHALLEKACNSFWNHLDMYKFLMLDGAAELVESNLALACMVALNRMFCPKKVAKPWRRAKSMLKMKRRKILAMCGFPESESLVRIFARMRPVIPRDLFFIRSALRRNPGLLRTLSFVDTYNGNVISYATLPALDDSITAQFLNEAGQYRECSKQFEYGQLVHDTIRMSAVLGERLGRIDGITDIKRKHDQLIIPYTAKMKLVMAEASFPEAPFDGVSTADFEISPVSSPEMLHRWAVSQHNCVMTRFGSIVMGHCAVYMITKPLEATLEVLKSKKDSGWKIGDFKGTCNSAVTPAVREHVKKWFDERKDSPRHVEVSEGIAKFTKSEYYAYLTAGPQMETPPQYDYNPNVDDVLEVNELERDTGFVPGPLPQFMEPDFKIMPVSRAEEIAEVLIANPNLPKDLLEMAKDG